MGKEYSTRILLKRLEKIEEELRTRNDLPIARFKQVHAGCGTLMEIKDGRWRDDGTHVGISWDEDYRLITPYIRLRCEKHNAESELHAGKQYKAEAH